MNNCEKKIIKNLSVNEAYFAQISATLVLTGGALLTVTDIGSIGGLSLIYCGIYCCTIAEQYHVTKNQLLETFGYEKKIIKKRYNRG